MFSIKWIDCNGDEQLYKGKNIKYHQEPLATVTFDDENGVLYSLTRGKIFVMGDRGETVSRYVLTRPGEAVREKYSAPALSTTG
jgi:hypothetical protein